MNILYSPVRYDETIGYSFDKEVVTVTYKGKTDAFDFSVLGIGDVLDDIDTVLDINPVRHAERRADGELYIRLTYYHGAQASEAERFPEWVSTDG